MRALRRLLGTLAVLTWIAVPLVVAAVVTARSERSVRSEPAAATWVSAGDIETEVSRTIAAEAEKDERPPLLAPAWSGLIEEVGLRAGQPLRSGDIVVVIDGIPRLAAATTRPLRRRLVPDDRGQDVADLNGWLASRRYDADDGDRFGAATRRGIRALRRDLGMPTDVDQFDPAWLVFLPQPEVTVRATGLQAGAPAPGAGSPIAELAPQVVAVRLVVAEATGTAPSTTDGSTEAPATTTVGAPPAIGGPDATPSTAPQAPTSRPLTSAAAGSSLRSAGRRVGPVGTDGSLSAETEAALLRLVGDQASVPLELVEPAPAGSRALPANALFTGPAGATCVATRTAPTARTAVSLVLPTGGSATRPLVVGAPKGDIEVQVNPSPAVRRRCRS